MSEKKNNRKKTAKKAAKKTGDKPASKRRKIGPDSKAGAPDGKVQKRGMKPGTNGSVFSEYTVDRMILLANKGCFRKDIARELHIPDRTFSHWLKRGRDELRACDEWRHQVETMGEELAGEKPEKTLYAEFVVRFDAAMASSRNQITAAWRDQALVDWKAAEKYLRLAEPQEYGDMKGLGMGDAIEDDSESVGALLLDRIATVAGVAKVITSGKE